MHVKSLDTMHQVTIYTLEAKTSHKISEAKKAQRAQVWKNSKRGWEWTNVNSAGQGYTCKCNP